MARARKAAASLLASQQLFRATHFRATLLLLGEFYFAELPKAVAKQNSSIEGLVANQLQLPKEANQQLKSCEATQFTFCEAK